MIGEQDWLNHLKLKMDPPHVCQIKIDYARRGPALQDQTPKYQMVEGLFKQKKENQYVLTFYNSIAFQIVRILQLQLLNIK